MEPPEADENWKPRCVCIFKIITGICVMFESSWNNFSDYLWIIYG
jgi:hypothetical protein